MKAKTLMNKIIKKPGFGELVEKKSKFLSEAYHIETVEEAEEYIAQTKHTHLPHRKVP